MESTGVGGQLIQTETKTTLFICSEPAKKNKKKRNKNKKKKNKTQVINEEVRPSSDAELFMSRT